VTSRMQLVCIWSGILAAVLFGLGWAVIAGFIPPPLPSDSARQITAFYSTDRTAIRAGQTLGLVAAIGFVPFFALISAHIYRIERGRLPLLAVMQMGGGLLLVAFFFICSTAWITASFRSDAGVGTVRALNDFGWLAFVAVWPEYTLQMVCIAVAVLSDKSSAPVWPRWFGYATVWAGVSGAGGTLAVFFKHGAFAWNGIVGIYEGLSVFVIWMAIMSFFLFRQARRDVAAGEATDVFVS
jgi:hypothetical protein